MSMLDQSLEDRDLIEEWRERAEKAEARVINLEARINKMREKHDHPTGLIHREMFNQVVSERDAAIARVGELEDDLKHLREIHMHGCECSPEDACEFVRERDKARDALRRIAKQDCKYSFGSTTTCLDDYPTEQDYWCSACVANAALEGKK